MDLQAGQDQLPSKERAAAQAVELPGNGGGEGEVGGDYQLSVLRKSGSLNQTYHLWR